MSNEKVFHMELRTVYPLLVAKAEKKGRTRAEVDQAACWLTGYSPEELASLLKSSITYGDFFRQAPALRRKMDIRAALHFFQLVPDGYPVSYYINLHQLLSSIPREVSPLRIFFITAVISASSRVLS